MKQYFAETLQVISFINSCPFCTDEIRVKVPSFQKVTLFLRYKILNRDVINLRFCLFENVIGYCHILRKTNEGYSDSVPSLTSNTIKKKLY